MLCGGEGTPNHVGAVPNAASSIPSVSDSLFTATFSTQEARMLLGRNEIFCS